MFIYLTPLIPLSFKERGKYMLGRGFAPSLYPLMSLY